MPAKDTPIYATGRRKTASARVYLRKPKSDEEGGQILINKREFVDYFPRAIRQQVVLQPLVLCERRGNYNFDIHINGGGESGQAGAALHGIARALEKAEPELRAELKTAGFLTRDPRAVERKKPGRHKARKKPQFSKR